MLETAEGTVRAGRDTDASQRGGSLVQGFGKSRPARTPPQHRLGMPPYPPGQGEYRLWHSLLRLGKGRQPSHSGRRSAPDACSSSTASQPAPWGSSSCGSVPCSSVETRVIADQPAGNTVFPRLDRSGPCWPFAEVAKWWRQSACVSAVAGAGDEGSVFAQGCAALSGLIMAATGSGLSRCRRATNTPQPPTGRDRPLTTP